MTHLGEGEVSARLRTADEQPGLGAGAARFTVVADGELTGGAYTLYLLDLPPGSGGAAPHFHRTFTESFHVLSGTFEVFDGRRWSRGGPGDHLVVPPGGIHGFRADEEAAGRVLMWSVPGAPRERYFAELREVALSGRELDPQEWRELYARHDQFMV